MDRGAVAAVLTAVLLASAAVGSPNARLWLRLRSLEADADEQGQIPAPPTVDDKTSNVTKGGSVVGDPPPPPPGGGLNFSSGTNSTDSSVPPLRSPPPPQRPKTPKSSSSERFPSAPGFHSYPAIVPSTPSEEGGKAPPGRLKGGGVGKPNGNGQEVVEKCYGVPHLCADNVTACFWHPENGANELFILVQNKRNDSVYVEISAPPAIDPITIAKNDIRKIKLPSDAIQMPTILKVGGSICFLKSKRPVIAVSFFQQLPSYATPEYGAYALFLSALIAGGAWACCKCRKRSRMGDSGILYQQLEMGVRESTSAVDTHVGEGWDEGWEDNWQDEDEEEEAGSRLKETLAGGGVSETGTTAISLKPSVRDEWEDWDD